MKEFILYDGRAVVERYFPTKTESQAMTAQPFKTMEEVIKSLDEILLNEFDIKPYLRSQIHELRNRIVASAEVMELVKKEDMVYKPYMGWCDVDGCKNESAANGSYYTKTGYWHLCSDHSQLAIEGKPQPPMKQSAIDRENSRDKVTGYLPTPPTEGK